MVDGAVALPRFASVKVACTVSPDADPVNDVGVTSVHARSGEPAVSVNRIPLEQLFRVSDSPSTGSTHAPT